MSTITVSQDIEDARERVSLGFESLRQDMTAHFWETFGAAAARYRGARNESTGAREFLGTVNELIRDARGTASDPLLRRGAPVPADYPVPAPDVREIPPMPSRAPWATMPRDGSGTLTAGERILYGLIGAACMAVLIMLGFLVSGAGSSPEVPAMDAQTSGKSVSESDMITRGAYWSWEAATECGRGAVSCDVVLARVNREAAPYGLHVWEDGSVSSR